jgi:hypothetical protein
MSQFLMFLSLKPPNRKAKTLSHPHTFGRNVCLNGMISLNKSMSQMDRERQGVTEVVIHYLFHAQTLKEWVVRC